MSAPAAARTANAFAPGHVSGLFAVHDGEADLLRKGSRGAGWSVDLGAAATVSLTAGPTRVAVSGGGTAPVTLDALRRLAPASAFDVRLRLDLPVGQGFGMSAAGTLAACLAAAHVLGLDPEEALAATHAAEVASGTGLGDAVGSWFGAGEVRVRPGCPPHGWAMRIEPPPGTRFLFCVLGKGIPTPSIIKDDSWKRRTRELADPAVDRILAAGRPMAWDLLLRESAAFSQALGLMPDAMRALGARLPTTVRWGQSMLGNTLWATGPPTALDAARPLLAAAGQVWACGVDANGARITRAA